MVTLDPKQRTVASCWLLSNEGWKANWQYIVRGREKQRIAQCKSKKMSLIIFNDMIIILGPVEMWHLMLEKDAAYVGA